MYLLVIAHRQIDTINTNGGGGAATAVAASSAVESATSTATEVTAVTVAAAAAIASGIQHDAWRQRQHAAAILCSRLLKFTGTQNAPWLTVSPPVIKRQPEVHPQTSSPRAVTTQVQQRRRGKQGHTSITELQRSSILAACQSTMKMTSDIFSHYMSQV